jgi:hydroxymethylbilane synthase
MTVPALRIGTRGSRLALAQATTVRQRLIDVFPELESAIEIKVIRTTGDVVRDRVLAEIGGKGLFAKEIEEALLDGQIDLAVHSLKDLPTWLPSGLGIASCLPREDPRDGLLVNHERLKGVTCIADLPPGTVIGTASLRRQAQILAQRRDLRIIPARGNIDTRVAKIEEGVYDATVLAVAGFNRLGMQARIDAILSPEVMLPAVAQGVIAIETRLDDSRTRDIVHAINDADAYHTSKAERAMLGKLDGSCRTPIGGLAVLRDGVLSLEGLVAMPDGSIAHRRRQDGTIADAIHLGEAVGEELRACAGPAYFQSVA